MVDHACSSLPVDRRAWGRAQSRRRAGLYCVHTDNRAASSSGVTCMGGVASRGAAALR